MFTHDKILLGSTFNKLNKAKVTGKLCLTDLQLLNIIDGYISLEINDNITSKLKHIYRSIQSKDTDICNLKNRNINSLFKYENLNINTFFGEMATFNININAKNNLPPAQVGTGNKTTDHASTVVFTRADFTTNTIPPYLDPEGDIAKLLKIITLPNEGTIRLNGTAVTTNQVVDFLDIDAGLLTYVPIATKTTIRLENFTFAIADAGSLIFSV